MQLLLSIARPADPPTDAWERFDPKARKLFLDALARLLAQAVRPELFPRENSHDR